MKKLFVIPSLILTIISSVSFAKSEGTYVGLDVLHSSADMTFTDNSSGPPIIFNVSESSIGYGFNAGHAFSLNNVVKSINGLYVAPNAYFNFNQAELTISVPGVAQTTEVEYSYGLNLDLGYDIDEKFSVYASAGYIEFRVDNGAPTDGSSAATSDSSQSLLYGVGVKYSLDDRLSLRLAYETFSQDIVDGSQSFTREVDVDIIKLGATYSF